MRPKGSYINIYAQLVCPKMANIFHICSRNTGSIRPCQKRVTVGMPSVGHAHPTCFIVNSALDKNHFEKCSLFSPQSIRFLFDQALAACKYFYVLLNENGIW